MRNRVIVSVLLAAAFAACSGDGKIAEPKAAPKMKILAAIATDPTTGATIETNLDDYLPGATITIVGRGWAPNENVILLMTEDPDTHPDVSKDVQADAAGAFTVDYYVVQQSDFGATFTLTATGAISGSKATATFTDGRTITSVELNGAPTVTVAPSSTITVKVTGALAGNGNNTLGSIGLKAYPDGSSPASAVVVTCFDVNPDLAATPSKALTFDQSFTLVGPATAGAYDVDVTIYEDDACAQTNGAATLTRDKGITIQTANSPPQVRAGADATIDEGATFSQNGSFDDPDANSWTATVDYGDGSALQPLPLTLPAKTFNLSHSYADNGTYTVSVTVNDGTTSTTDPVTVTVNNVTPVVSAGADATISGGGTFSQSGSFTDPGADTWTATVDYGDGGETQALALGVGKTFSLSHVYASSGTFTVTVTVTDDDGGAGTDQVKVNVNNNAPTVTAGADATLDEGGTFTQNGSFSDPDLDAWAATVDYGDGSGTQSLVLNGKAFTLSHVYTNDGAFTVTVTVSDNKSGSGSDELKITVNNVAPSVNGGSDVNVDEGSLFSQGGSFTDPGADTWTATVDYGDGSGPQTLALVGKTFTLSHTYGDNGTYKVRITVNDDDTAGSDEVTVTVANVAPTVNGGGDATTDEGTAFTGSGTFTDPGTDTWTATVDYGDGGGALPLTLGAGKTFTLSHTYADNGTFAVTVTVTDDDGGTDSDAIRVTVNNAAPKPYAGADATVNEGSPFSQNGSFADPGADIWTAKVNYGDGSGDLTLQLSGKNFALNHTYTDNGSYTVTVTVTDDDGGVGSDVVTVTVSNVAPTVTALTVPSTPVAAGTNNVTVSWTFTDPGNDTWSCQVSWDTGLDFEPSAQTFTANGAKTCSATNASLGAGIYTVTVKVTDDDGGSGTKTTTSYMVVYDPNAGFVTGGGWINSPTGAYAADPNLTGKANFGFVSKYKKGQSTPDGNTEFQFQAGNLNFKSATYDWLVVANFKAQFKGAGTLNAQGGYYFMLSAIDGQISGGGGTDKFRMKIWKLVNGNEVVVYDNQLNAFIDADPTTTLGGGSITIQAR
jgi:PKD repeat protein